MTRPNPHDHLEGSRPSASGDIGWTSAKYVFFPLYEGHFPDRALAQIPAFDFPAYLSAIDATVELGAE